MDSMRVMRGSIDSDVDHSLLAVCICKLDPSGCFSLSRLLLLSQYMHKTKESRYVARLLSYCFEISISSNNISYRSGFRVETWISYRSGFRVETWVSYRSGFRDLDINIYNFIFKEEGHTVWPLDGASHRRWLAGDTPAARRRPVRRGNPQDVAAIMFANSCAAGGSLVPTSERQSTRWLCKTCIVPWSANSELTRGHHGPALASWRMLSVMVCTTRNVLQ